MADLAAMRRWLDSHRLLGYDAIRVYLGIALFVRGWLFVGDSSRFMALVEGRNLDWFLPMAAVHYVALAHLVGGLMLTVGLLTRLAAWAQVPILFVATFLYTCTKGFWPQASPWSFRLSCSFCCWFMVFVALDRTP